MAITKQILADLIILNPKHKENTVSKLMRLTKDKLLAECKELGIELPVVEPKKAKTAAKPRTKKVVDNSTEEKRKLSSRGTKKDDKGDFVSWKKAQRWTKNEESGEYENPKGEVVKNMNELFGIFANIK
jgi:hypothetical protein